MLPRRNGEGSAVSNNYAKPAVAAAPVVASTNQEVPPKPQFIESSPTETVQDIEDDLPF